MKKQKIFFFWMIIFLIFSNEMRSQNNLKNGVNELEISYAENYASPSRIEFVFSGNPKYLNYFFSNLEEKIKEKFQEKDIKVSFRYLNKQEPYVSESKVNNHEFSFFLNIDNSTVIDEKSGYDRVMKFDFNGQLITKDNNSAIFSFKSVIKVIHDITNKNEEIVDYLLSKLHIN